MIILCVFRVVEVRIYDLELSYLTFSIDLFVEIYFRKGM